MNRQSKIKKVGYRIAKIEQELERQDYDPRLPTQAQTVLHNKLIRLQGELGRLLHNEKGRRYRKQAKNLFGLGKGTPRTQIERQKEMEARKAFDRGETRSARKIRKMSTRKYARTHGLKVEGRLRGAARQAKAKARKKAHGIVDKIFGSNPVPALLGSLGAAIEEGAGLAAGTAIGSTAFRDISGRGKKSRSVKKKKKKNPQRTLSGKGFKISADFGQASDRIFYKVENGNWHPTPFQVADSRHSPKQALKLVSRWLKGEGSNPMKKKAKKSVKRKNPSRRPKKITHAVAVRGKIVDMGTGVQMKRKASMLRRAGLKVQIGKRA